MSRGRRPSTARARSARHRGRAIRGERPCNGRYLANGLPERPNCRGLTGPSSLSPELLLDLDAGDGGRRERLEAALRAAIREGRLRPGDRLPATRALASELGCSRWVVVEAYDQLAAEGWLEGRPGSGTRLRARAGVYEPPPGLRAP